MTIKELKEALSQFDDDLEVMVDRHNKLHDIEDIYEDTIDETVYILITQL